MGSIQLIHAEGDYSYFWELRKPQRKGPGSICWTYKGSFVEFQNKDIIENSENARQTDERSEDTEINFSNWGRLLTKRV